MTFAFTDIEGSTARWERDREAMQDAVRRHDSILRCAILENRGHVFKTIGDAFCAAFARPSDALAAMLAAQHRLADKDFSAVDGLRVRMALHYGTADERDGDYFGPAVNRVARMLAVGHGGQVLVSRACAELIGSELPPACSLRDLGEHRLKDLAAPERIHQLLAPDLIADFPPLRSLEYLSNNLPAQVSSFIGREQEIDEIAALIQRNRLVTIAGTGGVGKTRLSLQAATDFIDRLHDGVWFVELAPLTKAEYVPTTVASALRIALPSKGDPVESIARALKRKEMLLIFDNCEHLIEPAAHVISAILHAAPNVKVLASSRQGLGVTGEATYQVPSLNLANGIELFVERARAASTPFALTDENRPVIAEICRRLDGIPLAIELAGARVKMLGVKQLRDRLDERFRVLTGGKRDALPRQQTLRALIDWSHALLDERERRLFRRLGIFVGGFAFAGAAATAGSEEEDVFDVLASLVDKSLVLAEPQGDELRYRLLESTRAYALEKLDAAGERGVLAGCHLRYLRDRFAAPWEDAQRTARSAGLGAALHLELDDLRAALDGALVRGEGAHGGELLASIGARWRFEGLNAEGMTRLEAYLAALPTDEFRLRAALSTVLSFFLGESGRRLQGLEVATQAVEPARTSRDRFMLAAALHRYAHHAMFLDRLDEAESALAEAEAIPGATVNFRMVLLEAQACLIQLRGDLVTAARKLEELREKCRALGDNHTEQVAALNLAEVERARGRTQRAIEIVRELLPARRSGTDKNQLALLFQNLAGYLVAVNDASGAAAAAREAIGIYAAREPDHVFVAVTIEHLAFAAALSGDASRAAVLEGYADAALARHRFVRELTEKTTYDGLTSLLRNEIAPEELARLVGEGAALAPESAVALALADIQR